MVESFLRHDRNVPGIKLLDDPIPDADGHGAVLFGPKIEAARRLQGVLMLPVGPRVRSVRPILDAELGKYSPVFGDRFGEFDRLHLGLLVDVFHFPNLRS
ncbi:hypothetical protein D3C76_1133400 [compost metagenome]